MNGQTFAVVTTDGREHPAVDLETIQRWYTENHLSDESLVFSSEAGDWRLLNRIFDTATWGDPNATVNITTSEGLLYHATDHSNDYFDELTSLAVPPDADFSSVQHFRSRERSTIARSGSRGTPGLTALVTFVVFGVFGIVAYFVLTNFVFYEDTVSFTNNHVISSMKTQVLGKPFNDPAGAKVTMPAGWSMVAANMPEAKIQAADPKMFSVNFEKKMFAVLEIVPADGRDLKSKMSELLQRYRAKAVGPFSVIADHDTQIGAYPARKSIFSRRDKSVDANTTTHMLVAYAKGNLYVYQIWAPTDKYASLLADFDESEHALALP